MGPGMNGPLRKPPPELFGALHPIPAEPAWDSSISAELLDRLERRYTPADQQKCIVCGAPLTFSASGARYNCSSDDASPVRSTKPLHERLDHYAGSAWRDHGIADSGVVALVRAYRKLEEK